VQLKEDPVAVQHLQTVRQRAKALEPREAETETLVQTLAVAAAERVQMVLATIVEQIRVMAVLDYKVQSPERQHITRAAAEQRAAAVAAWVTTNPAAAVLPQEVLLPKTEL
jgi:hypothetical protein